MTAAKLFVEQELPPAEKKQSGPRIGRTRKTLLAILADGNWWWTGDLRGEASVRIYGWAMAVGTDSVRASLWRLERLGLVEWRDEAGFLQWRIVGKPEATT